MSFQKIQSVDLVDFFSCCRLCVTSYGQEKMTPLFVEPTSWISSIITKIFPLEIKDGDGLPDSICHKCVEKLDYFHNFIKESLTADRLLRKVLIQAQAATVVLNVEDAADQKSSVCDPIAFESKLIGFEGKPNSIKPIGLKKKPNDFDDEPTDFPSNPDASECESIASSGSQTAADLGDHSYSRVPNRPVDPTVPGVLHIEKSQSIAALKLAKPNIAPKTKGGYVSYVDPAAGQTSHKLLECSLELEGVGTRLEPEKQQTIEDPTSMLGLANMDDPILSKAIIRKKIIPGQHTHKNQRKRTPRPYEPVRSVSCEICGKEFSRRSCLRDHVYTHTGERPFACATCGKAYSRRHELNRHIRTHTESVEVIAPHVCKICGRRNVSKSNLRKHMAVHSNSRPFACPICKKGFKLKAYIPGHLRTHTDEKRFACTVCGKRFKKEKSCSAHEAGHSKELPYLKELPHLKELLLLKEPLPQQEPTFQCHMCDKAFGKQCSLTTHLAKHTRRDRDFECANCNKWFFCRKSVKRHIQVVHLAERPFACPVCEKGFEHEVHVRMHLLTHADEKQFVSTGCREHFKKEESCSVHVAENFKGPPLELKFQCHLCGKAFGRQCSLKTHLTKHSWRDRDFQCAHCNKWFFCSESIKRHIQVAHLAERLFP